ncbi:MAG TPA: hypothetical protein VHY91_14220 [Pirellulales bacterium]|jgi:hypothetical protein|nr:hypothetical protein [Pirellulales bacterium]
MAEYLGIAPSNLLVDSENPRLSQPNEGQRETMRALAKAMPGKIVALAKDIVAEGLSLSELPIVMPADDEKNRFIVLEGNRRLVALKALENPDTFIGSLDAGALASMRSLSKTYRESPIDLVQCVAVKNRAEAEHWIMLRHTGENEGAGVVRWGGDEANRFRARRGPKDLSTQALDYLEAQGVLTPDERAEVPASTLRRVLGTPEVRAKLGLGLQGGELQVLANDKKVAKALKYVASDLASGKTTVSDLYKKAQRKGYADKLPASVVVAATKGESRGIQESNEKGAVKTKSTKKVRRSKARDHLIPSDCILRIRHARIRAIEGELRTLSLESHTNAVAVLLRVFIELSADEYISSHSLAATAHDKLRNKLEHVLNDLLTRKKLTAQQAKPVRKAMARDSYLLPSIDLMHDYIHNQNAFPAPGDLRAHWSSLQPFVMATWSP